MASSRCSPLQWWSSALCLLLACSYIATPTLAAGRIIYGTDTEGRQIKLQDNRQPALYTSDFGDCQGDSLINVTRFDAAYYKDNMTILFHLAGSSALVNESLMLYIGVYAYGEPQFDMVFNPCGANIFSLCPLNASVPIEANGIIPVSAADVSAIPSLALTIPDFEGQAILRIYSNSTESQIGCYSAAVTNGLTFSHPSAVGTILGIFALLAVISSVAPAMYGSSVPDARSHYAHSLSVFVVFAIFHHIYFTGALSVNWPSVLVAFWSNYAWSAGMIHGSGMQNSINQFSGENHANISMVGSAPSGVANDELGGGYSVSQIFKRSALTAWQGLMSARPAVQSRSLEQPLTKRELLNSTTGFSWYGEPVRPGLPLPGNFSGFPGTVAEQEIPVSNAFMTALLWFLILLLGIMTGVLLTKGAIEGLYKLRIMKTSRLAFFRAHWLTYLTAALLRTVFIAFFMFMFLTTYQFTLGGSAGVLAIAAIVFVLFFLGMLGAAAYALHHRLRGGRYVPEPDRLCIERKRILAVLPWYGLARESTSKEKGTAQVFAGSLPWWKVHFIRDTQSELSVHDDEEYTRRFGWLASRFRRSKWWFFAVWLVYEFVRACLYGGAAGHAPTQVFGLLVVEFIAFVAIIFLKPFEGRRLNVLLVYVLGFSKIATVALSSAFDTQFNLNRITTTIIAIVIIVIQGFLTILLLIAIVLGAISSYMSLTRNRAHFRPKKLAGLRTRYLAHVEQSAADRPPPRPEPNAGMPALPVEPYFRVASVRRQPKIEDDDADKDLEDPAESKASSSQGQPVSQRRDRAQSMRSQASLSKLPYGARPHRASWSSRDLQQDLGNTNGVYPTVHTRMSSASMHDPAMASRSNSVRERASVRPATQAAASSSKATEQSDGMPRHHRSVKSISRIQEGPGDSQEEPMPHQKENEARLYLT